LFDQKRQQSREGAISGTFAGGLNKYLTTGTRIDAAGLLRDVFQELRGARFFEKQRIQLAITEVADRAQLRAWRDR